MTFAHPESRRGRESEGTAASIVAASDMISYSASWYHDGTRLLTAHPNPFNPRTELRLELERGGEVALDAFAMPGRHVRTLHRGELLAGMHAVTWDGTDDAGTALASEVHVTQLHTAGESRRRKLALIR